MAVPLAEAIKRFDQLAQVLPNISNSVELWQTMVAFTFGYGIKMASYHHLPPPGALDYTRQLSLSAEGYPKEWVDRYIAEFAEDDPITRLALTAADSFFWSDVRSYGGLTPREINYLNELEKANLGDGLAIPVFGPSGRSGYVGLGFGADGPKPDSNTVKLLSAGCQLGHQQYCNIVLKRNPVEVSLSPRETEILTWIARGKSNAVIAQILAISSHTVDTHLRRVFGKLGVQDRVTAALRGYALGML